MEQSFYRERERESIKGYNLRCIDGTIHGCGKCVAFCSYEQHSGFLTPEMERARGCKEKGCFYHYPKPLAEKRKKNSVPRMMKQIIDVSIEVTSDMEGLRVMRASLEPGGGWVVYYAAISHYDVKAVEEAICDLTGCQVSMRQINCGFDVAAALIMGKS